MKNEIFLPPISFWPWETNRAKSVILQQKIINEVPSKRILVPEIIGNFLHDTGKLHVEKDIDSCAWLLNNYGQTLFYFIEDHEFYRAKRMYCLSEFYKFHKDVILQSLRLNFENLEDTRNSTIVCCNKILALSLKKCFDKNIDPIQPEFFLPHDESEYIAMELFTKEQHDIKQEFIFEKTENRIFLN